MSSFSQRRGLQYVPRDGDHTRVYFCRGVEIIYGDPRRKSDGFGGPRLQSDIGLWVYYLISVVFWLYSSFICGCAG